MNPFNNSNINNKSETDYDSDDLFDVPCLDGNSRLVPRKTSSGIQWTKVTPNSEGKHIFPIYLTNNHTNTQQIQPAIQLFFNPQKTNNTSFTNPNQFNNSSTVYGFANLVNKKVEQQSSTILNTNYNIKKTTVVPRLEVSNLPNRESRVQKVDNTRPIRRYRKNYTKFKRNKHT